MARIAFVSFELADPDKTGGVGSWVKNSALLLASAGYEVVVYYVLLNSARYAEVSSTEGLWRSRGIALRVIDWPDQWPEHFDLAPWMSLRVLETLRNECFDVIHFHDVLGFGHASVMAKRSGAALQRSALCVTMHGCTIWHRGANGFSINIDQLFVSQFEADSIRECDYLLSPSKYMLQWAEKQGYSRKGSGIAAPNVLFPEPAFDFDFSVVPVEEFVFFGRLEPRKGLDLFCQAIVATANDLPAGTRVTFLGKSERGGDEPLIEHVKKSTALTISVITDADSKTAQEYLKVKGRVAVIPSRVDNYPYTVLECAANGIPFLAAAVGGISEIIHPEDACAHLFVPDSKGLQRALVDAAIRGAAPARLSAAARTAGSTFLAFHDKVLRSLGSETFGKRASVALFVDPNQSERDEAALLEFAASQLEVDLRFVVGRKLHADTLRERGYEVEELPEQDFPVWAAFANAASSLAKCRVGFFFRGNIRGAPNMLSSMANAQRSMGADAVVVSTGFRGPFGPERPVAYFTPAGAGPVSAALVRNIFGAFAILLDLSTFRGLGGFTEAEDVTDFEHWEYLTRLLLFGKKISALPEPMCEWEGAGTGYRLPAAVLDFARWRMAESAEPSKQALMFLIQSMPDSLSGLRIVQDRIASAMVPAVTNRLPLPGAQDVIQWGEAVGYHSDQWCSPELRARITVSAPSILESLEIWYPATLEVLVIEVACNDESVTRMTSPGEVQVVPVGISLYPGGWIDFRLSASDCFIPGGGDLRQLSFVLRRVEVRRKGPEAAAPSDRSTQSPSRF